MILGWFYLGMKILGVVYIERERKKESKRDPNEIENIDVSSKFHNLLVSETVRSSLHIPKWFDHKKTWKIPIQRRWFRATSHTQLRARDHHTSSTLISGKDGVRSKFTSHYARGTNGVCECNMEVESTRILTWHRMDHVSWSLGGRPNSKPGDHGTPNIHNRWRILLYHVWGPAWIEIHWNSISLRARSHMASHHTWRSVTTLLHDVEGMLGRWPSDTFVWALIIRWSQLLARVWSGPLLSRPPVPW